MEGLAILFLGLGAIAASQEAAYAQYRAQYGVYQQPAYVAQAEPNYYYPPAYVYAPAPQPVPVAPATYAPAREQPAPARSTQFTDQYTQRWQGFMEPAGRR